MRFFGFGLWVLVVTVRARIVFRWVCGMLDNVGGYRVLFRSIGLGTSGPGGFLTLYSDMRTLFPIRIVGAVNAGSKTVNVSKGM